MRISLDKTFVLELYCYSYQGERSIHFALGREWAELLDYYRDARIDGLKSVAHRLNALISKYGLGTFVSRVQEPGSRKAAPARELVVHLYRHSFGKWLGPWKSHWYFSDRELGFMAAALNDLVSMLESGSRPSQEEIVALRMDLCQSRSTIEDHCYAVPEIKRALDLEHFWSADWLPSVTLTDILGDAPEGQPPARKSA
jgi:hypothetical protein